MQDIEFTIENGKLFILQTRSGKELPKLRFALLWNLWKRYDHEGRSPALCAAQQLDDGCTAV